MKDDEVDSNEKVGILMIFGGEIISQKLLPNDTEEKLEDNCVGKKDCDWHLSL